MDRDTLILFLSSLIVTMIGALFVWCAIRHYVNISLIEIFFLAVGLRMLLPRMKKRND